MIRKTLFGILFVCTAILFLSVFVSSASASTLYVPDDYTTIQAAVDAAGPGDVIVVRDGTYKENVDVNKPHLTIKSENGADKTTVETAHMADHIFEVTEDYVNIIGFTVIGSKKGIYLNIVHHCNIKNNNISSASIYGIYLSESSINNIINNTITCKRATGIILSNSFSNNINNNTLLNNSKGIYFSEGSNNIVSNNTVSYNDDEGILLLFHSESNSISNNTVSHNGNGIDLNGASVKKNNITNNVVLHNGKGIIICNLEMISNISNNIVSSNSYGIYICSRGTHVSNNIVSDNTYGIYLLGRCSGGSFENAITNNTVFTNTYGIYLHGSCRGNTINDNNVTNNDEGIVLTYRSSYESCSENIISGNNVSSNTYGIRLFGSESNNITRNSANWNTYYGIYLSEGSSKNIITQNTASNNYNGIYITESSDNLCYLNNFANKADNVYSYKSTNTWNSTEKKTYIYKGLTYENYMGNYWSDYTGSDTNGDGIGDIPYHISTEASDMFQLMKKFEAYFTKTKPTKTSTPKLETIPIGGVGNNQEDSEVTHITTLHDADETGECFDFSQNTKIIISRSGWADYLAGTEGDLAFDSGRLVAQDETIPHLIVYKEEQIVSKCKEMGVDDESWDRAKDQILSQIYGDLKLEEISIPETGYKKAVFPALQGLIYFIKCKDEKGYAVIRLLEVSEEGLGMYKFEWIYYDTGMLKPTPTPTEGSIEEEIVTAKCGKITNWKTMCQGVYSPGQKVGAEMEFENLMDGGYNFKGVILIRSPTGDEYTKSEVEWVPSAPNPHGKFAAGDALYVTIPEGASAGNYDMQLELWNDDTDELCDATEWKDDLFTVEGNKCPMLSDGTVEPLEGGESTNFVFSVTYKDEDGDEPVGKYVRIIGFQGTKKLYDETKEMIRGSGDIKMGVTYTYSTTLPAAEYCYSFYFSDGECAAYLPEGGYPGFEGPNVTGVTTENHPPTATKIEPTSDSITIEPGDTQEFKVKAEDVDEEEHNNLKMIEWFVDDVLMETDAADGTSAEVSFSYTFENAGTFSVKATVYDEQMHEASVTWEVNVGEAPGRYTLKFEGYDLNEENDLKITIVNSETIYLSPDDPAANDVWRSYEIDISNFVLMDDDHNIVNFFGGHCGWKDIQILRNGEIIRRFHPNYIIKPRMEDVTSVSYEFNPFRAPTTYTHAGLTTIEMYAPKEAKKGVPYIIEIVAQVPRAHDIYFTGNGVVQLCYSEEIDINLESNHITVRSNEGAWDDGICYSPEDCDLGRTYYEELLKLMFLPGMGFTLAMIEEYEKCNFDDGYCKLDNYNCGPPSSTEWKDINNYDTCNHIYDSEFLPVESIKMDKIISRYSLTFNNPWDYTVYGFFNGIEVDIDYLDPGNRKIGKELVLTVKVVE